MRLSLLVLILANLASAAGRRPFHPDPGGVLKQLTFASFGGSGQNSIQAVTTDASGNVFVAGTTNSPDLSVKNAMQPAFGDSRILRTTDLGVTWLPVRNPPAAFAALVPDPVDSQTLYTGGGSGIAKTTDGGQSWTTVFAQPVTSLVVDPGNRLRLAARTSNGVVRSLDGGATWLPGGTCNCGMLFADPNGTGALAAGPAGGFFMAPLLISRDWGLTFTEVHPPGNPPSAFAFVPSHPGWVYADTAMGVMGSLYLSTDYGEHWTARNSPNSTFSRIMYLAVDPDQPDTLIAITADGWYKSSDGAASWTRAAGTMPPLMAGSPVAIMRRTCAPAGAAFAVGSGGASPGYKVLFTPDYGTTWTQARLSQVTGVVSGPGCAAYVTRDLTTDGFVAKLAPDGTELWVTYLGGSDLDAPVAMKVDSGGYVYVAGNTSSPDFPATLPRIGETGSNLAFVTRLSPEGRIDYSVLIGGEAVTTAAALAVDPNRNAYLAGSTNSARFPTTPGVLGTTIDQWSYTGFLIKLSSDGALAWSTYLGPSYTYASAVLAGADEQPVLAGSGPLPGTTPQQGGGPPDFVVQLDRAGTRVTGSTYIDGSGPTAYALASDEQGNVYVSGATYSSSFPVTPGAYRSTPFAGSCPSYYQYPYYSSGMNVFVMKLAPGSFNRTYSALVNGGCGVQPGALAVDRTGAAVLGVSASSGFPLRNPLLGGPTCTYNSSVVARLSPDGSTLDFSTYLDSCGSPGLALAADGSVYVGVGRESWAAAPAGVVRLMIPNAGTISLEGVANAFSGDAQGVTPGGLYTLRGTGFDAPELDLGLNPSVALPYELGGVRVKFDGMAAAIVRTAPNRVTVVTPARLPAMRNAALAFTSVEVDYGGVASNRVQLPVLRQLPGLLTTGGLDVATYDTYPDAIAYNEDGTRNDADHPAAVGSMVTVFATGMGLGSPATAPAAPARAPSPVSTKPVYSSWQRFGASPFTQFVPETVYLVTGYLSAMVQMRIKVPEGITRIYGSSDAPVTRVPLALNDRLSISSMIPPISNLAGVYVKTEPPK